MNIRPLLALAAFIAAPAYAQTSVSPTNRYAYGANTVFRVIALKPPAGE